LFFRDKHLFVAAMNGIFLGGLSSAVARLSGLSAGQLWHSHHARPHERLQSLWLLPEQKFCAFEQIFGVNQQAPHVGGSD
jgi:hypothetical protein